MPCLREPQAAMAAADYTVLLGQLAEEVEVAKVVQEAKEQSKEEMRAVSTVAGAARARSGHCPGCNPLLMARYLRL